MERRRFLRTAGIVAGSFGAGLAGTELAQGFDPRLVPRGRRSEASTNHDERVGPVHRHLELTWAVQTSKRLVALTFDDGPAPRWTPMVLDHLAEAKARATFFLVGEQVRRHGGLLRGRLAGHEVGNHTWGHQDLSRLSQPAAVDVLRRAHREIAAVTGKEPVLMRPPFGRLGGAALFAAADLGYRVALWSLQMRERDFLDHPAGLVDFIVNNTEPGTIVLGHDVGAKRRLVALRNLPAMITGLRRRGFELVTVSELLAEDGRDQPDGPEG